MGVQISCCFYSKVPPENLVPGAATAFGRNIQTVGRAEGERDRRRASPAGSRTYDDRDSTQVRSVASDWIHKREERDTPGESVRGEEAQFCGAALLGTRVLGVHSGTGREGDSRVHTEARGRRQAIGPIKPVVTDSHRKVARDRWGRVSDPE